MVLYLTTPNSDYRKNLKTSLIMQWIPGDISNLTFRKPGMFGNISSRKLKDSCEISSAILKNIWNFEFKKNISLIT